MSQAPPPHFCSMVVRLIALQIQNTNVSTVSIRYNKNKIYLGQLHIGASMWRQFHVFYARQDREYDNESHYAFVFESW
jgi:hypothetical protein